MLEKGLVQIYTGDGKGKTTAALGLALRAVGNGLKVLMVQFMKGTSSGEFEAAQRLSPFLTIRKAGREGFIFKGEIDPLDLKIAQEGFLLVKKAIENGEYDIVILDEINVAVAYGLIGLEAVLAFMKNKPEGIELILTGRYAPEAMMALADTVTEMKEIRHHYNRGVAARKGIEY